MDVLADSQDILSELDVHFEANASEAAAAAMLAASVHYPIRGAVAFTGAVGVNVASDALANLASSGVTAGRWWWSVRTMVKAPRSCRSAAMPSR